MDVSTQDKVKLLLKSEWNKVTLSEELDMSRPTLDRRLSGKNKWGKLEIKWINYLYEQYSRK